MATEFNGGMIQDGTVDAAELASNAVTTAKIAAGAVTDTKLTHSKGGDIASAGTIVIDDDNTFYDVTGTTTITGMTVTAGRLFMLQFDGALTLTHGSGIDIPGGANLTTAAGDRIICFATATDTVYVMTYVKADGEPVVATGDITLGTEQATTSGTSIDFTSIPSGTKRVTINIEGMSTDGTSVPMIQIGDSGGIETSGYLSGYSTLSTGVSSGNNTAGISLGWGSASVVRHGTIILTHMTGDTWAIVSMMGRSDGASTTLSCGSKTLSAELDRVRLTTVGGTDNFDAGAINITYE